MTAEAGTLNRYPVDIDPTSTGAFVNGVWTGDVSFHFELYSVQITAAGSDRLGQSNYFNVLNMVPAPAAKGVEPGGSDGLRRP